MNSLLSRRGLLSAGAFGFASLAMPNLAPSHGKSKKPKNIIFMVADGMSMGSPAMLDHYLQLTEGKSSFWRELLVDPEAHKGLQDTRSLSSIVTDSAAASSSWGCGRHVWNGMLNAYPDGTKLRPLYDIFGEKGIKRGLVSTTTITDATPAGFAVSVLNRGDDSTIAAKYLDLGIDVILGGGAEAFLANHRKDGRDLFAEFAAKGYAVAKDKASLEAAHPGKLIGLFCDNSLPFYVDRLNNSAYSNVPGLEAMTRVALDRLKGSKEGFVLQVEGARVDHAAHANDFAALLHDQLEFDRTVRMAVEWAKNDGETLVVVTSDHANSNPGLDGDGDAYFKSTGGLRSVGKMKRSYEAMLPAFAATFNGKSYDALHTGDRIDPTVANVQALVENDLGVQLTKSEATLVADALVGKSALKSIRQYDTAGSMLAIALNNHTHVGWTGRNHTDDYVLLSAVGPGAEAFAGLNQNTSFFDKLLAAKGLKWKNPAQMSQEDALKALDKKHAHALADSVGDHWL